MEENEVKKIKQLFRKGVALALAAVTTLSVLPAATVSAASQRATITFAYCYDGNGNTIRYQQTASHNGITFSHAGEARTRIYADGDNAYCIEPGISLHTGNTLEKDASVVWNNLGTPKTDGTFSVYNDIRDKLIARGIPPEEIAFIHDANTDVRKKELFSKVRRGAVRILMGSTFKMGAGTNVQDRIIASHDLDCPWRPRDVGRILRTFKIKKNVEVTDNGKDNF